MKALAVPKMAVFPREYRLVVERLLQYAGLDRGIVVPLRETLFDAELATGSTLRYVVEHPDRLAACAPDSVDTTVRDGVMDGAGRPALLLAPAALDALRVVGELVLIRVHGAEQLRGLAISGIRHGLRIEVHVEASDATLVARRLEASGTSGAAELAGGAERLHAMVHGIDIAEDLWWTAYRRSNLALSIDTRQSRRHAGATIVEPDGTIRGAPDEDIDLTVYSGDRAAMFDESRDEL